MTKTRLLTAFFRQKSCSKELFANVVNLRLTAIIPSVTNSLVPAIFRFC